MKAQTTMTETEIDWQLELLQTQFDKQFGKGVFGDATSVVDKDVEIIKVTPSLDIGLSGGIPGGSWVTLTGKPKHGKSTMALTIGAAAQKQGRLVVYVDVEGRIKKKNLMGIEGLDLSPDKFRMIRSTRDKLMSGPDYLNQILSVLESVPRVVILIDSISSLAERKEMEEGIEAQSRGGISKQVALFCRVAGNIVATMDSLIIGITHRIANTSGFGPPGDIERSSNAWKYQRDILLRIKRNEAWEITDGRTFTGSRQIGQKVTWCVDESALGAPGAEICTYLRYNKGFDREYEIFSLAIGMGLLHKAEKGAWITGTFMGGAKPMKWQGEEKAYQYLMSEPTLFETLREKVMENLGEYE